MDFPNNKKMFQIKWGSWLYSLEIYSNRLFFIRSSFELTV
jgi:hypothetical protein